MQKISCRSVEK